MKSFVIVVEFQLKPACMDQFMPLMLENAAASRDDEPGCQRFDVLTTEADANHILLYEIYDDQAAFETHLQTPHFVKFRDAVKPLVEQQVVKKYWLENKN